MKDSHHSPPLLPLSYSSDISYARLLLFPLPPDELIMRLV